ncbi:Uncharacterised protein [uncultured archaeon]|nr:Uncharacterised protein [uncultured archaeon]
MVKLFTVCYTQEQFEKAENPWDNLKNVHPELREFPVFEEAYRSDKTKDLKYWGLLSPKFPSKAFMSVKAFQEWIEKSPSRDVYFVNPVPIVEAIFPGVIQHGENCHSGMKDLLQRNISTKVDFSTLYSDCNTFAMCNYFVGNRKFWDAYIKFVQEFSTSVEKNPQDKRMMYEESASYGPNKSLPYYTFAVERLFTIFLQLEAPRLGITFAHYTYSFDELVKKTSLPTEIIEELVALSDIKQIAISAKYYGMMRHWAFFRNRLAKQNPYLFLME